VDEHLYHYTTADGFHGILTSQQIRATNYSFLNDSSEFAHGLRRVQSVIGGGIYGSDNAYAALLQAVLVAVEQHAQQSDIYVACFSSKFDDLNQWRGYGGDKVDRYCMGFKTRKLDLTAACEPRLVAKTFLAPVIYNYDRQRDAIVITFDQATKRLAGSGLDTNAQAAQIAIALLEVAATFKDAAFSAESEWRVIVSLPEKYDQAINFIVDRGHLKPYLPLVMKESGQKLPLTRVLILPDARAERARKATQLLLAKCGYPTSLLDLSGVPFVS
jgi:hypothetical protein